MIKKVYAIEEEDGDRYWLIHDDDGLMHWHPFPGKSETQLLITELCMEIQRLAWADYERRSGSKFVYHPGAERKETPPSPKHLGWLKWRKEYEY